MLGDVQKITKNNLLKGIPWRFGPNWPGKRCEAKTRKGTPLLFYTKLYNKINGLNMMLI